MKEDLKKKLTRIEEWTWREGELGRWQRAVQHILRLADFFIHEAKNNALTLRANALTYIIILSMVPVMALGTAVLKGLGAEKQMKQAIYRLVEQFENPGGKEENPLAQHIKRALDKVFEYVDKTNFATLGIFGIAGLIWAVLSTLSKIESAMNQIWKVEKQRPWGRRIMDYTALTVILPLSLNIAIGATAAVQIKHFTQAIDKHLPVPVLTFGLINLLPVVLLVATFFILYRFLPNTHVDNSAALFGSVAGALGWMLVQIIYVKLQIGVTRYNAIYGSFATIPLFLIWLNLGWLMFLLGAQLAFVFQHRNHYNPTIPRTPIYLFSVAVEVMKEIHLRFSKAEGLNPERDRIKGVPQPLLLEVLECFKKHNLIKETKDGAFVPSKPADALKMSEIMEAVCGDQVGEGFGAQVAKRLLEAAKAEINSVRLPTCSDSS